MNLPSSRFTEKSKQRYSTYHIILIIIPLSQLLYVYFSGKALICTFKSYLSTQSMASKPSSSRPPVTSTSSVRRNLFHHHLSRRPTSTSTSTSATTLQESAQDDSSEIAVRGLNGDYQVQILRLPPMDDDQAQEDEVTEKESK